jgi:hypothetical protein
MTTFQTEHLINIDFSYNLKYFEKQLSKKVDKITKCVFRTMIRFLEKKEYKSAISYWYSKELEWSDRDSKTDHVRAGYMALWIYSVKQGNDFTVYGEKNMEAIPLSHLIHKLQFGIFIDV